jgi:LemA protein
LQKKTVGGKIAGMNKNKWVIVGVLTSLTLSLSSCGWRSIPTANNEVEAAWAEVVNQYKRRADLIPNLVEVVGRYAKHEKETLEGVVSARAKATAVTIDPSNVKPDQVQAFVKAQEGLSGALSRLMVVAEKYPDLKANENFRDLQVQLEGTENRVTVARNRYIDAVKGFNLLVTVPPESWFNSMLWHYEKKPQFTVENEKAISDAPKMKFE